MQSAFGPCQVEATILSLTVNQCHGGGENRISKSLVRMDAGNQPLVKQPPGTETKQPWCDENGAVCLKHLITLTYFFVQ
jgi:hypothetical protein